jgi:nucleoid-associated protein YgaU
LVNSEWRSITNHQLPMQKDLKIGLFLGLVLAISALLWLATRPSLSPIARMTGPSNTHYSVPAHENFISPNEPTTNEASTEGGSRVESDLPSNHGLVVRDIKTPSDRRQAGPEQSQVDARESLPDSAKYEQAEKIKPQKFHVVLKGQTLSSISYKYYGSTGKWQKIFDYNRNVIKDPDKLIPGTKLIIPE